MSRYTVNQDLPYNLNKVNCFAWRIMNRQIGGFTLVEFITILAIAAIFIALAVPGYKNLIPNNQIVGATNKLSASLNHARMEAVKRGVQVSVCPTANIAFTACGDNTQWQQGWIVFTDADKNNAIETSADRLKVAEALPSNLVVSSSSSIVSYDGAGFVTSGASSISLSSSGCTGNNARVINISTTGRLSVAVASCN